MSQTLMIHGAVSITQRHDFYPEIDGRDAFNNISLEIIDSAGNITYISIFSVNEIEIKEVKK